MARISWYLRSLIARYQETFSVIEKVTGGWEGTPSVHLSWASADPAPLVFFQCPKPVIAAIHGGCIGGGESTTPIPELILAGCLLAAALLPQPMASSSDLLLVEFCTKLQPLGLGGGLVLMVV